MKWVFVFGIIVLFLREGLSTAEVESSSITGTLSEIDRLLTVNKRAERGRREFFAAVLYYCLSRNFSTNLLEFHLSSYVLILKFIHSISISK